jgi:hypothetical protein
MTFSDPLASAMCHPEERSDEGSAPPSEIAVNLRPSTVPGFSRRKEQERARDSQ